MVESSAGSRVTVLLLLGLGVVWGATFPVARLGLDAGADPFVLVSVDLALATAVMVVLSFVRRSARPSAHELGSSALVGILLIGGINLPLFWGEQYATGGAAAIVYATAPLVSVVTARLVGRRWRLGAAKSGALALGLLGVVVLTLTSAGTQVLTSDWAVGAFALGALCQGTGAVLFERLKPHGESSWGLAFEFLGGMTAALVTLPFLVRHVALPFTAPVVFSALFLALGTLVLGYSIFFELVRRAGPVRANTVTYLNPLVALAVGVLAFGESFQVFELAGLAIVLVALWLLERPPREVASEESPSVAAVPDLGRPGTP